MRAIVDVFLSPLHIARLRALLQSHGTDDRTVLRNLWLLSPSIHRAFRGGHVNVEARGLTSKSPETKLQEIDRAPEVSLGMLVFEKTLLNTSFAVCDAHIIPRRAL
jgi:hypothetical protein